MVNLWVRVMHGVESTEESAAFFIDYCRRNKGLLSIRADDKSGGNFQRLHRGEQRQTLLRRYRADSQQALSLSRMDSTSWSARKTCTCPRP